MSGECSYVFTRGEHKGIKCDQIIDDEGQKYCPIHTALTGKIYEGRSLEKDLYNLEEGLSFKKLELEFHRMSIKLNGKSDDREKKLLKDIEDGEKIISAIKTNL